MRSLLALFGALLALVPALALAHGGGVPQVTAEPVGDYRLYVWTDPAAPRAGDTLHVTVGLTLAAQGDTETPVTDAAVSLRFERESGRETGGATGGEAVEIDAAPGAAAGGVFYEADTVLSEGGSWRIGVKVAGAQGQGEAGFTLDVVEAPGLPWGWLLAGAVLLAALALVWAGRGRAGDRTRGGAAAPAVRSR